ncbi:MAG: hypothetical protein ACKV0T_10070 [Planctomycetales bacterium]
MKTLRATDNHFFWYEFEGLPKGIGDIDWDAEKRRRITPLNVNVQIDQSNTVVIGTGASKHRVWLCPTVNGINFEKRVGVRINGTQKFNDFVKPDVKVMLETVRLSGDRQHLYWAVLDF